MISTYNAIARSIRVRGKLSGRNFSWLAVVWMLSLSEWNFALEPIDAPLSARFDSVSMDGPYPEAPNFQRHVVTLLGRLGCNSRSCHGSFQGRGGFRLSMFGYDFEQDHQALLAGDPVRVDLAKASESLILRKPTLELDHEGGERFKRDGWEAKVIRAWIANGAVNDSAKAGKLVRIEITPNELLFEKVDQQIPLRVVAHWSDSTREDVGCLSLFRSLDDRTAAVDAVGRVTAVGSGDTYIVVNYDNAVVSIPVILPMKADGIPQTFSNDLPSTDAPVAKIDQLVLEKLRKLGQSPSNICSDEEFFRRVSIDITGTLPTPDEIQDFVSDTDHDKRNKKINLLLEMPAYALWWSTLFADLTGLNAPQQLGSTDFGPIVGEQWRSWMERKIRDNIPYDKLVEGMVVAVSRQTGQSYEDYARHMSSYTQKKDPVDFTERESMPHFWFRGNLTTNDDKALAFAYAFMGIRLDCAQCHKHPFDRWSQQDFKQFAALFDRVRWGVSPECKEDYDAMRTELGVPDKLSTAAIRRQSYWRWAGEGKAVPWPEVFVADSVDWESGTGASQRKKTNAVDTIEPKLLGDSKIDVRNVGDPRRPLMDWLRETDHPYFARAIVNRVWAHYFGRGLVDPPDDLNLANPPSNPAVLDYLSQTFVERGYDLKWLHREITGSATYQRSWRTNASNRVDDHNFSHAMIRRLPAEVIVDAMVMATGNVNVNRRYATITKNRRIGAQVAADLARTEFSLAVFGKPLRTVNCDCEREQQPSLSQAIFVRNDRELHAMLDRPDGWIAELKKVNESDESKFDVEATIREAFLRSLSREPRQQELERARQHVESAENRIEGIRDLLWGLLNTQEFITNH